MSKRMWLKQAGKAPSFQTSLLLAAASCICLALAGRIMGDGSNAQALLLAAMTLFSLTAISRNVHQALRPACCEGAALPGAAPDKAAFFILVPAVPPGHTT